MEKNDLVPTVMKVATARGVESKGQGKALQTSRPSIAAKEVPSRDGSPYHWILASVADRVGSSLCTGHPTINISRTCLSLVCTLKSPAVMGEGDVADSGSCSLKHAPTKPCRWLTQELVSE